MLKEGLYPSFFSNYYMTEKQAIPLLERDLGCPVLKAHFMIKDRENYQAYFVALNASVGHLTKVDGIIIIVWHNELDLCLN